jgi:hypothetical protein
MSERAPFFMRHGLVLHKLEPRSIGILCLLVSSVGWGLKWSAMKFLLREWRPLFARGSAGFRFCQAFLQRGYHSVVRQLETVRRGSIHGGWIQVLCPFCSEPTPYRLNPHLLDAPFRCGNCRTFYCAQAPHFVRKKSLTVKHRAAMTRLRMH